MCTLYRLRKAAAEVAHLFGARLTAADLVWRDEINCAAEQFLFSFWVLSG
jgi:hypothetical protein